ncbi:unnamed protein product [Allacma fusca]|uniref:Uncharacterized protein n=1 Tax=Allacma fusca TaxID=39272 RepID=A0A8J2LA93_9HEXA|nr:unnamed protein product [Allacma fusca]
MCNFLKADEVIGTPQDFKSISNRLFETVSGLFVRVEFTTGLILDEDERFSLCRLNRVANTPPVVPANNHFNPPQPAPGVGFSEVHLSPAQRSAMQSLQHANTTSFGSFISQESHFGNSILPVLPRFDNMTKPN